MYAIVKTGGKQYRVQEGQNLLIERLPDEDGASVSLTPLLYVDGDNVVDGKDIRHTHPSQAVVGTDDATE